jgi:hypothetical protein
LKGRERNHHAEKKKKGKEKEKNKEKRSKTNRRTLRGWKKRRVVELRGEKGM